jgi:hypothetical protein
VLLGGAGVYRGFSVTFGAGRVFNGVSRDIRVLKGALGLRKISSTRASTVFISGREAGEEVLDILHSRSRLLGFYSLFNLCLL